MKVALVHDYLTQRGGAERVVLSLTRAFPGAPVYTSLYDPDGTFPEFADVDVRTLPINRIGLLRRHHRLALPLLAPSFSRLRVKADVVICSSSGWAHGARVTGTKIVYCYTPARWLYQPDRYLRGKHRSLRAVAELLRPWLVRWDKSAAATADCYIGISHAVADRIRLQYGVDAEVIAPPPAVTAGEETQSIDGLKPGFVLCVSRLLAYKNVDAVIRAFDQLSDQRLVVAGSGPEERALRAAAGKNVTFAGRVTDAELRWLYANCSALVAASHEDFGLTPLEAAGFGKPTAALRWGGFLDTVVENTTGVFFDTPGPYEITGALSRLLATKWDEKAIRATAESFSEARFIERMRTLIIQQSAKTSS